jgi:hypothetical protein
MADGLGEERSVFVEDLLCEVIKAFESIARREWLEWGGRFIFSKLQSEVDVEVQAATEAKQREEEEAERQWVTDGRAKHLEERREALRVARVTLAGEFRAKTLSKEDLRERNTVLQAEARAIEVEEWGDVKDDEAGAEIGGHEEKEVEGNEEEKVEDLPVIRLRKWRVETIVEDDEGEEELDELDEGRTTADEVKRPRLREMGLLTFKGPVSRSN